MSQIREYNIRDKEACLIALKSNVPQFFAEDEINLFEIFLDTFENKLGSNKTYFYVIVLANEIIGRSLTLSFCVLLIVYFNSPPL